MLGLHGDNRCLLVHNLCVLSCRLTNSTFTLFYLGFTPEPLDDDLAEAVQVSERGILGNQLRPEPRPRHPLLEHGEYVLQGS
jgi:hypothetical protein